MGMVDVIDTMIDGMERIKKQVYNCIIIKRTTYVHGVYGD